MNCRTEIQDRTIHDTRFFPRAQTQAYTQKRKKKSPRDPKDKSLFPTDQCLKVSKFTLKLTKYLIVLLPITYMLGYS